MIGDFTEITVSNSDNGAHLIRPTSARFEDHMPAIPEVEISRWDTRHAGGGDIEDGVILDFRSFSSLHFTLHLYFCGSQPSTNGVGTGFYHLQRQVQWRWSFTVLLFRRMATLWYCSVVGLIGSYVCIR
jgi:hypothetical protein